MVYTFQLVASTGTREPSAQYFEQLATTAQAVVRAREQSGDSFGATALADMWRLCEYLDAVDGQCMAIDKALYRQARDHLIEFMRQHESERNRECLARKSWAAQTVRQLVAQQAQRERVRAVA